MRGYEYRAVRWEVEPAPGEITREQAIDLVVWAAQWSQDPPLDLRDETTLRQMDIDVTWTYSPPGTGFREIGVRVDVENDERHLWVYMTPEGEMYSGNYEEAAEGS